MSVIDYIEKMRNIEINLLDFIEDENETDDNKLSHFLKIVENSPILEQQDELIHFIQLLTSVFENHHRTPKFVLKFEDIFNKAMLLFQKRFSNFEIYDIFQNNKRILLFLIKSKILKIDQKIFTEMSKCVNFETNIRYFQPEIKLFIEKQTNNENLLKDIDDIDKFAKIISGQIDNDFNNNREIGENESYLCKLIREDSVILFIQYITQNKISINSKISESLFESNSILQIKEPSLIEYESFFGSIQIFRYLLQSNAKLPLSLWKYAIHSQNGELIHLLEENNIKPEDECYVECYKESVKCFHNDIAIYIKDSLIKSDLLEDRKKFINKRDLNEKEVEKMITNQNDLFLCPFHYHNYVFFPDDLNVLKFPLFYLYQLNYKTLLQLYFNNQEIDLSFTFNIDDYEFYANVSNLGAFGHSLLAKEKKTQKKF